MTNSNFRFDRDPFGVYQFSPAYQRSKRGSVSTFLSVIGIIIAIFGIVILLILRKTIWKLITRRELPELFSLPENATDSE